MNRITAGTVAIGAAVVLLLGSAGSLAYWQQTDTIPSGTLSFQTGELSFSQQGDDVWQLEGIDQTPDDLTNLRLVPGDTLTVARTYAVEAQGDSLFAELSTALGALNTPDDATEPLSGVIVPTIAAVGDSLTATTTPGVYEIDGSGIVTVTVTIDWPFEASTDAVTMGQTFTLGDTVVTLTQVPAPIVLDPDPDPDPDPCACP